MKMTHRLLTSLFIAICCNVLFVNSVFAEDSPRKTINFNREWKYIKGDYKGAEQPNYNDEDWESVGLPHSFSMPYFMSKDFYVGYGWYRKEFSLSEKELSKRLFLEFDGVFQQAEVFVNGEFVGGHIGGYTGFSIDISSKAKVGDNQVAVRVNNIWRSNFAPRAGEHLFSGGIYRNVRLVLKSPVYIDWYGTKITTPDLEANQGKSSVVKVFTDVCNKTDKSADYKLVTKVVDDKGKVVSLVTTTHNVEANGVQQFVQTTPSIKNPVLWSTTNPTLYKVITSLFRGKQMVDSEQTTFGFRWINWSADKGFFLNGEHIYLKGVNVHQDQAGWGDAITEAAIGRDINQMKEAGFDFIRGSHYPHAPAFSHECDKQGMLFWSEAPFWGIGGYKPDGYWDSSAYPVNEKDIPGFEESALQQLAEMIKIHRNHPSIIAWSMCNEPFFSAPETLEGVRSLLKKMVDLSRRLDPTRPAAVGGVQRPLGNKRLDMIGDVAGYNGDGGTIADFQNPGVPNLVSEYGSTTADRPGEYIPGWGDLQKNDGWKERPWRSGQAIWCGFDHGSIAGSQLGKMGIVDYFRIPKRSWYWYRNEYRNIAPPQWAKEGVAARVKLEASKTKNVKADGTDDAMLLVTILDAQGREINNSPSVTLRLVSGPGEFPTGSSITFDKDSDIRIMDGKAAIAFRSYYAGTAQIEAISEGLESSTVTISFVGAPKFKEGETPKVKERPYVRFTRASVEEIVQTFGRNNPTFATSSAVGHTAGYAADGDEKTWWQAEAKNKEACWTLDTEKGLALREIKVLFSEDKPYQYFIETSADNENWVLLKEASKNVKNVKTEQIRVQQKVKARFVRIRFCNDPAVVLPAISEVVVKGVVLE